MDGYKNLLKHVLIIVALKGKDIHIPAREVDKSEAESRRKRKPIFFINMIPIMYVMLGNAP